MMKKPVERRETSRLREYQSLSDEDVVAIAVGESGDRESAIAEIDRRYRRIAQAMVKRRIGDVGDSHFGAVANPDDTVQEAMISILHGLKSFSVEDDGSFSAWAQTIIARRAVDAVRNVRGRRGRKPGVVSLDKLGEPDEHDVSHRDGFEARNMGHAPDAAHITISGEDQVGLRRAMEKLSKSERYVIEGLLDEKRLRDVADELGVTESRACQLATAAKKRLRELLRGGGLTPGMRRTEHAQFRAAHPEDGKEEATEEPVKTKRPTVQRPAGATLGVKPESRGMVETSENAERALLDRLIAFIDEQVATSTRARVAAEHRLALVKKALDDMT